MKLKPPTDYNKPIQEILDGLLVKNWNPLRKYYHRLHFHDIVYVYQKFIEIYNRVHGRDVIPRSCFEEKNILNAFQSVFEKVTMPVAVLELGAWNGALAKLTFDLYKEKIIKWHGCDICPIVVSHSICKHPLYNPILLLGYLWEVSLPPHDIFVCSHTFEHMNMDEVYKVLTHQKAKYLVLEIPMKKNWDNFEGGHINTASWEEYKKTIEGLGYKQLYGSNNNWVTSWEK